MRGIVPLGIAAATATLSTTALFGILQMTGSPTATSWEGTDVRTISSESTEMAFSNGGPFGGFNLTGGAFGQFDLNFNPF